MNKEEYAIALLECYLNVGTGSEFRERSLKVYGSLLEEWLTDSITSDDLVWIRYQLNYAKDELLGLGQFSFYYVNLWEAVGLPTKEGLESQTGIFECSRNCLMSKYTGCHWCFRYPSLHELPKSGRYIYMLFDGDDLVYIGQTKDPNSRLWSHQKDKDFDSVSLSTRGPYGGLLNKQSVSTLEKRLIRNLSPKLNVQHKIKSSRI